MLPVDVHKTAIKVFKKNTPRILIGEKTNLVVSGLKLRFDLAVGSLKLNKESNPNCTPRPCKIGMASLRACFTSEGNAEDSAVCSRASVKLDEEDVKLGTRPATGTPRVSSTARTVSTNDFWTAPKGGQFGSFEYMK